MQFFAKEIIVDQHGKATNFRLHSLQYPHMRSLHLAWISFMVAFLAWYSIPPLMPYIASDLKASANEVYDSNVAAVSATIGARLVVGPFCERYGPRRVMAVLLLAGAIPCAMTGLLHDKNGLIILRFVIGILGATFVPTQFWATQMFSPSIVGTANAITGGWGNLGAGVTYLIMPAIYDGIRRHLPQSKTWRIVYIFPALICILVAIADLMFGADTPQGDWSKVRQSEPEVAVLPAVKEKEKETELDAVDEMDKDKDSNDVVIKTVARVYDEESIRDVKRDESPLMAMIGSFKVLAKPSVLIMVAAYACSFGIELAIDNVIGKVFLVKFKLNPSTAAYIGSIFGLLNIFSRLTGGLFSDFMAHRLHLPGRILALLLSMALEGVFLIGFSYGLISLTSSITLMVFFSFFVQHVCGSTFAIVPFIDPVNNGKVMGIVGAGGNLGGLLFNIMFRGFGNRFEAAFLCLGCITLGVAIIGCALLRVQNKWIWDLFGKQHT
jgi:NNP family nitrate/nitrite transporter-like MFS transporter